VSKIAQKIFNLSSLNSQVDGWKKEGLTVAFTNGCFDILHQGHVLYLEEASTKADKLIIAVNSDASVSKLKGPNRPVKDENSRALILAALGFVDGVIIFSEDTPLKLIKELKPHVLIKGGDYDPDCADQDSSKYIVGRKEQLERGDFVEVIQFVDGHSSTNLINKMKA
jgi:rfaE bifunctional protein nucleotidyltransferase chain/domain